MTAVCEELLLERSSEKLLMIRKLGPEARVIRKHCAREEERLQIGEQVVAPEVGFKEGGKPGGLVRRPPHGGPFQLQQTGPAGHRHRGEIGV